MAKILAIDDNRDNLTVLSALLAEAFPEIEFISAISGKKGIELCLSEKPDVILLDILMPGMDGFEVCQILKANEITKTIPIIIITAARTDQKSRIKALEAGADAFLAKPLDELELTAQIKAMLRIKIAEDLKMDENARLKKMVAERTESLQKELNERKKTEELLQENEAQFRAFFEKAADAIFIAEIDSGIVVDANEAASRLMLRSHDELVGIHQTQLHPPVIKDIAVDTFNKHTKNIKSSPNSNVLESKVIRADGVVIPVEILASAVNYHGKPCMMGTFRDITERKKSEESLRLSEERLRLISDSSTDIICSYDLQSRFTSANRTLCMALQLSEYEIIGKTHEELHFPESKCKEWAELHEKVLTTGHTIFSESTTPMPDGDEHTYEISLNPLHDTEKKIIGIGVVIRDITEKKKSEELLRESVYFFKESQRAAFVGSYKFNFLADYWTSSEVLEQIFGIDKSYKRDLQGWLGIIYSEDRDMMARYFSEEVIAKQQPFNREYRIISQLDEELRWVQGLGKLNLDAEGNVVEMIGTIQDITERKLAELARSETFEFTQSLLKTIPFGMAIVDEEGKLMFQSSNLENVFTSKAIGRKCWELYCDEKAQCIGCPLIKGIEIGKTEVFETSGILGGRVYEISYTGTMFKGKKAMLEIFQDITDRKRAEAELRESQQLFKGLFNASPDAIVLIDPHHPSIAWPIVDCNEAACRMNGYSREELIGQSIDILNTTTGSSEERIEYLGNLRKHTSVQKEALHRHKDGHIIPIEVSTSVITIDGNEMILGIDRDITDRKQHELAIHVSEARLKRAELTSKSGNWEYYLNSKILNASEGAKKVFGVIGQQFRYEMIREIALPEYRLSLDVSLKNLIKNDLPYDSEFKIRKVDSGEVIDIHSVAFFDRKKRVLFGIVQDISDIKHVELELVKSEDRYRSFISQISEGVYRFECDIPMDIHMPVEEQIDFIYHHFFLAECNKAFLEMYGISDEKEVIGKTQLDFHGGDDNLLNRGTMREFVCNSYRVENALTHEINKHGHVVYFSNNSLGIIENNQLVRIWGTQADISEKTRADQIQQVLYTISNAAYSSTDLPELIKQISQELGKLLDSTNFFIAFYDEKTDMLSTIYETDEKDEISSWPAGKSITGYVIKHKKPLLVNRNDVMNMHDAGEIEIFGTPSEVWLGVPLFTGTKIAGALVVQSYDNPNAYTEKDLQILEFISHQISVSIERKKTEQELKLMGKAFNQSPVTIEITDRNGNIEYVNPKFSETTGYTMDEVKGQNPRILRSGDHSKEFYKNLWETILAGNDWVGEFHNKRKNGESYWESAVISPITNEQGEITFFLALKEDITEKKKMIEDLIHAREAAEESDRLKSAFLANMSHEIRTPLNAIIGFSELIRDPAFEAEQQDEFAQLINDSGNNLLSILSDIMDISKIEAGQVSVSKRRISVNKLINSIQKEFAIKADRKGVELRISNTSPDEVVEIETDETRIRQIIVNFLSNAIKFTETGYIELGIEPEANGVRLYVKDTGIGIPEAYHEKVFERFRQVETSHTRKYGGNGLGLCISKNLIELLGGTIGMESEEGKGSMFFITMPRN